MRLDKFLAHAQIGTRKEVKQMIRKGRVSVNGMLCKKDDTHIDETQDSVFVDGEEICYEQKVYLMLNKPAGVVSATQDSLHETVLDCLDTLLPKDCFPVGRLDIDTEGLLLITNDGKLAHALLSPRRHVEKVYEVRLIKALSEEGKHLVEDGVIVLDGKTVRKAKVVMLEAAHCLITIQEGRYHQIKRMFLAAGNEVVSLKRIQMGPLKLDESLQPGEWRRLKEEELASLRRMQE